MKKLKINFSYMNPYSPISWLYVHGFLGQNFKSWILRLLLDIWKSGSVCGSNSWKKVLGVYPNPFLFETISGTASSNFSWGNFSLSV